MISFFIIAALVLAGAVAAVSLRNLVHCALALTVALAGIGILFLELGAQFAGFAQILVYIGAVAILIVFAILLTRGDEGREGRMFAAGWLWGGVAAVIVAAVLCGTVLSSQLLGEKPAKVTQAGVSELGSELMRHYVLPLEIIGVLLTAALIGAVVIAIRNKEEA